MTTPPQEPGDQPTPHVTDPVPHPAIPAGAQPPATYPAYPGTGYEAPSPPPSDRAGKTSLVVTGVVALLAGIGIGVGAMALATSDGDPNTSGGVAPIDTTSAAPTTGPGSQSRYSMSAVTNACDLIDPTLLHQWSSTPEGLPVNRETRPTSLSCTVKYSTPSAVTPYQNNKAQIELTAEFTDGEADSVYESWKRHDTHTTGAGLSSGTVNGIGAQGHWHSEVDDALSMQRYVVCVQDANVVVRVLIILWTADGEPPVRREDLNKVARSEARMALDGLKA